jgi:release factor glutamine methyltransferase
MAELVRTDPGPHRDSSREASLIAREPRTLWRAIASRLLRAYYLVTGKNRYDDYRFEQVHGLSLLILPSVANPRVLRTGAFFAAQLDGSLLDSGTRVLDLGTGSGVCALAAARHSRHVVAVDINPAAVRCARINALLNGHDARIEVRHGDLFAPVAGERFDLVLFNPPFQLGTPRTARDAAWCSSDVAPRFAAGLAQHLTTGGRALLLLSSFGDACASFETELRARGFRLEVFAGRRYVNECLTLLRVTR